MTDENATPTTEQQDAEQSAAEQPAVTEQPRAASEAAKYRTQLRATEAERDTLTSRLEAAHRTMVESIAGKSLAKPEALWASGVQLQDLLDDDGNVDQEKVAEAISKASDELGLMKPANGPVVPNQGKQPERGAGMRAETFADAFGPR